MAEQAGVLRQIARGVRDANLRRDAHQLRQLDDARDTQIERQRDAFAAHLQNPLANFVRVERHLRRHRLRVRLLVFQRLHQRIVRDRGVPFGIRGTPISSSGCPDSATARTRSTPSLKVPIASPSPPTTNTFFIPAARMRVSSSARCDAVANQLGRQVRDDVVAAAGARQPLGQLDRRVDPFGRRGGHGDGRSPRAAPPIFPGSPSAG